MFIDRNLPDFLIWKAEKGTVLAKFRIVGILERANGSIYLSPFPQPYSFDTSKATDPTRGALSVVQFQANDLTLDELNELKALEVKVETAKGQEVEHYQEREDEQILEDGSKIPLVTFEHGSKFPLVVVVKNWKLNKKTTFIASIEKVPHESLPNEVVFHFKVDKKEERLEVLTDHPRFEAQKPKLGNGDGDGRDHRKEPDPETGKKLRVKIKEEPMSKLKGKSLKEVEEEATTVN